MSSSLLEQHVQNGVDGDDAQLLEDDYDHKDYFLGLPLLRTWEITENTTIYEKMGAATSDENLVIFWKVCAAINVVLAVFSGIVILAILCDKKARQNSFNLFLLYLMIPDFVLTAGCFVICVLNFAVGHFVASWICELQAFVLAWSIFCNNWVNFAIARELHWLLKCGRLLIKYHVPSRRDVSIKAMLIYGAGMIVGCLGPIGTVFADSGFPIQTRSTSGLGCAAMEYDTTSTIFYYSFYLPLLTLLPALGVGFIALDIMWWSQLMPPTGRRRLLAIYFLRIVATYIVFWLPFFASILIGMYIGNPAPVYVADLWVHLQSAATTALTLSKPDIQYAVRKLLFGCFAKMKEETEPSSSSIVRTSIGSTATSGIMSVKAIWPIRKSHPQDGIMRQPSLESASRSNPDLNVTNPSSLVEALEEEEEQSLMKSAGDDWMPQQRPDFTFEDEDEAVVQPLRRSRQRESALYTSFRGIVKNKSIMNLSMTRSMRNLRMSRSLHSSTQQQDVEQAIIEEEDAPNDVMINTCSHNQHDQINDGSSSQIANYQCSFDPQHSPPQLEENASEEAPVEEGYQLQDYSLEADAQATA